jgi:hypothetical protein
MMRCLRITDLDERYLPINAPLFSSFSVYYDVYEQAALTRAEQTRITDAHRERPVVARKYE